MGAGLDAEISAHLRQFVEQTRDFVGVADGWGRVLYVNPAAAKRLGIGDPTGLTLADLFEAEETAFYHDVIRPELLRAGAWNGVVRVDIPGEGAVRMSVSTTATIGPGGAIDALVVHARDVRAAGVAAPRENELDETTGLLERSAFDARLDDALAEQRRGGEACGLVLVDVSGVHDLIETVGRFRSTTILRSLAHRLQHLARAIDVAGRVDDDHFALLLGAVRGHGEVARIAAGVCESLAELPVPTAGGDVAVVVRCGAALAEPGDEPVDVYRRAGAAMVQPRPPDGAGVEPPRAVSGRPSASPNLDEFRVALSLRAVRPYAQRVVDLRSGRTVGYRGTSRWHHGTLGVLEPAAFLDLVAGTPLATQLDLCVLRELAEVLTLSTNGHPLTAYSPVSTRFLADVRAGQYLTEIADAFYLSTEQMRLQVARALLESRSPSIQDAIWSLRETGVGFVLTGVEAASDVRSPVEGFDEVHLSGALTRRVATDERAQVAAADLIRVAHEQSVRVGAAGVDNESDRDVLIELGCELGSGDLYGAPEPARDID